MGSQTTLQPISVMMADGMPRVDLDERDFGFFKISLPALPSIVMLSLGDCQVVRSYIRDGVRGFEPFSLTMWTALAKNSQLVVDVGAYTGIYSLVTAAANPHATVVAFEAHPITFGRLITNIIANSHDSIVAPLNIGASNRSGHLDLTLHGGIYTMSSGESFEESSRERAWMTKRVDTIAADEILLDWNNFYPSDLTLPLHNKPVDLIKIDVEGHEKSTLSGLRRTIYRDKPIMLVEILKQDDLSIIVETLPGYDAFWVDESGAITREWVSGSRNALFVHGARRQQLAAVAADIGVSVPR